MKIIASPEGRANLYLPEKESIIKFIESLQKKEIHCFLTRDNMPVFLGADWEIESLIDLIQNNCYKMAVLTSDDGSAAGHRLVILPKNDNTVRYSFDIGAITEENIEIV